VSDGFLFIGTRQPPGITSFYHLTLTLNFHGLPVYGVGTFAQLSGRALVTVVTRRASGST
jgi:hypothetical protein